MNVWVLLDMQGVSVSIHTPISTHNLHGCGPTTLKHTLLIRFVIKVMNLRWTAYDCEHTFTDYFPLKIGYIFQNGSHIVRLSKSTISICLFQEHTQSHEYIIQNLKFCNGPFEASFKMTKSHCPTYSQCSLFNIFKDCHRFLSSHR